MAIVPPGALARAVVAKLYVVLTTGTDSAQPRADDFFNWITAGMPLQSTDLENPETLARLVDFVPDVTAMNRPRIAPASAGAASSLSSAYGNALKTSQVVHAPLPDDVTAKMEKFRGLLQQVVKIPAPGSGREVAVTEASPLMLAYLEGQQRYAAATLDYNNRRLDAQTSTDSRVVSSWSLNGELYRQHVDAALNEWVTKGHKNDVDQINAFVSHTAHRDMSLLKAQYLEDFDGARVIGPGSDADYFTTSLVPTDFATSSTWTQFTFGVTDFERYRKEAVSSLPWTVHASDGFLGLFAGAQNRTSYTGSLDRSRVAITCELAEVPIVRQWFHPLFLTSRSWRLDRTDPEAKATELCDGANPPAGRLPAYCVSAVFARNLSLSFGPSRTVSDFLAQQAKTYPGGSGFLSFGPFFLGSGASAAGCARVADMQLIGFRCHALPKCPDPDPAIPDNAWA